MGAFSQWMLGAVWKKIIWTMAVTGPLMLVAVALDLFGEAGIAYLKIGLIVTLLLPLLVVPVQILLRSRERQ